jgi:UTP--glucose-1-phosphate uridylyltransferase
MTSSVKKAVIPAAGLGTRFLPATKAQPKEMLALVDKPAIQYVVEEAVAAGITDILIITGRGKRSLEDHFDRSFELEYHLEKGGKHDELEQMRAIADMANIHYVRQGEPRGLGHAVGVAREHVGKEPFAVMLGDDIMHERSGVLTDMLKTFDEHRGSVVALREVPMEEISLYGCADVEAAQGHLVRLRDIIEKPTPAEAPSNLAVMGRYVFTPQIFDVIDKTQPGKGNEIQLTDAIKSLLDIEPVYGWTFVDGRFDIGNKLDYLRATVELALEREDLGPAFREYLIERMRDEVSLVRPAQA